ncbi:MAG TPA: hypothetical protein VGD81_08505 [Opitutaceae bacterium]
MIALCLGSLAVAAPKPPFRHEAMNVSDGCFVESVAFYDDFRERMGGEAAWVRVLQWGARENDEVVAGHAVAVYEWQGQLWAWDINYGLIPLTAEPAQREDAAVVAAPVLAKYPRITARYPLFRHDFPQTPDAASPGEIVSASPEERPLRDASRVAARLAKHRPVKLVRFPIAKDGATMESAACAFVFHGRLCIYFPGYGTVPFRARALNVHNLRQLQECIRRVHPGVGALTAL